VSSNVAATLKLYRVMKVQHVTSKLLTTRRMAQFGFSFLPNFKHSNSLSVCQQTTLYLHFIKGLSSRNFDQG